MMRSEGDLERALRRLRAAPRRRLFLDYDGTLVDIAPQPELATADVGLHQLLQALAGLDRTEVVVVSGRARASLQELFDPVPTIGLSAEHGLWLRKPSSSEWLCLSDAVIDRRRVLAVMQEAARRHGGARVEQKERAVAFHHRNAVIDDVTLATLKAAFADAGGPGAWLLDGDRVLEVLPRGVSKALAIPAMDAGADDVAVFAVGDDTTDLSLLAAAPDASLVATVGVRLQHEALWFDRPATLRAFLRELVTSASSSSSSSAS
jgi:trehalose 6-phosphate synthase/phosphatase